MIGFLLFLIVLLFAGLITLGVVFYYLHKRVETLADIISTMRRESAVLYENQQTLAEDIKKLLHGLQNVEEKIIRLRDK